MRNMSFLLTIEQIENQTKTVTRRNGWLFLEEDDCLRPVEKCQGLKKGEKIKHINAPALIQVLNIRREPLNKITQKECTLEGFPDMDPAEFIEMYCKANKCNPNDFVTRIEFKYLPF